MDSQELLFTAVLDRLFDDEIVSIPLVFRLSDLFGEDLAEFQARWPSLSGQRRLELARHMADISEENFQVDFSAVLSLLLGDPAAEVRLAALDGLWDCSSVALVDPILSLVREDADETVRSAAAATLGHYVLMSEWGQLAPALSDRITRALLAEWDRASTPRALRRAILETIGASSHERVASLIDESYRDGDEAMRLSAVFAMGRSADDRWSPQVRYEMESDSEDMRLEAARAAGAIGGSDFVGGLAELVSDEDLEVRLAAINAMGMIGGEWASEILHRLAEVAETDEEVDAIEEALGELEWLGGEIDLSLLDLDDEFPAA